MIAAAQRATRHTARSTAGSDVPRQLPLCPRCCLFISFLPPLEWPCVRRSVEQAPRAVRRCTDTSLSCARCRELAAAAAVHRYTKELRHVLKRPACMAPDTGSVTLTSAEGGHGPLGRPPPALFSCDATSSLRSPWSASILRAAERGVCTAHFRAAEAELHDHGRLFTHTARALSLPLPLPTSYGASLFVLYSLRRRFA